MLMYLVDDLGESGEYAGFLNAHRGVLPSFELRIFTHYQALLDAVKSQMPDILLADMRFDSTPCHELYGDIDGLAQTEAFGGNVERAESQVRGIQGLLICRALRENGFTKPIILFSSLPSYTVNQITQTLSPIYIIEGLILRDVKAVLHQI